MTDAFDRAHTQAGHRVRLEWGPTGAAAIAGPADVAVVVDVLSFTTTLVVALDRGTTVHPYRWKDERAAAHAAEHDAVLAVGRLGARHGRAGTSLSPAALAALAAADVPERLVLPSPNGSTICSGLADRGCAVVGACLRNAAAVAAWLAPRVAGGATVAVVAAGERWPDDTLRPAVEDLWGAGAVLAALADAVGPGALSPEAAHAAAAYRAVAGTLHESLLACASGAELVDRGFADDVRVAAETDVSTVVPLLVDGAFRPAPAR
ncbi:2-phosphosulfolactate phosphatase [Nocardioides dongxiaopingii]|uniref:2-phosphosulfolactate phosphatase n=1 Tax=Nocardioides sp. S-1144 TaxID=2582905 RepID=UPI00110F66F4|nr:2-phosphosulfolactate phosphatase [Nocardioides sp. S-1144]QCW49234.1 2-phosphosulfolactate phosphatase [Nocardioides sp. S-1144]